MLNEQQIYRSRETENEMVDLNDGRQPMFNSYFVTIGVSGLPLPMTL